MVTAFKNHVHADMVKNPQYIKEGDMLTTPTVYGVVPTNPNFTDIDIDGARLVSQAAYETVDRRKAGTMGRIGQSIHKERYTAQLTFNASNGNAALQVWAINESLIADNNTASNPISLVQSYKIAGTETYEQLLGCLPTRCNITVGSTGHIVYTVDLMVKQRIENTVGPTIGTGSFATTLTQAPWVASDGGANHFDWDTVAEALDNMTITIDRQYGKSSPTEVIRDMFNQETVRDHTGSFGVITRTQDIYNDAFAIQQVPKAMNINLKSGTGGVTIAFGNTILTQPAGRNIDPTSADPWLDTFNFSAETAVASINP